MRTASIQFVDQEISQIKYKDELLKFNSAKDHYRNLGVLLINDQYPNLYFGFAASSLTPVAIIFAVKINFTNYDVQPLSVQFVHPLTLQPVLTGQIGTHFPRKHGGENEHQALLQAVKDDEPFLCIPGVREYHDHPFHSGDSWLLHRKNGGEGSLCFILDNLQLYGTSHIKGFHLQVAVNINNPNLGTFSDPNSIPT